MKYRSATAGQRFFAYLIDTFIISVISSLIAALIPIYKENYQKILSLYNQLLENPNIMDMTDEFMKQITISGMIVLGITSAITLPLIVIYYIVLPLFWKRQTIGRLALGLKVVTMDEKEVKVSHLILREFVGGFIIYGVLTSSFVLMIINLVLCVNNGRSIADYVSQTRLINSRYVIETENSDPAPEKDYVDATFRDVDQDESNNKNNTDDYQVF